MKVDRRSISMDSDIAARVDSAAAEDRVSFSAWMTNAADFSLKRREGLRAVAAWEADHGAFTAAEMAQASWELDRFLLDTDEGLAA